MSDINYEVAVDFVVRGDDFGSKIGNAAGATDRLGASLSKVGGIAATVGNKIGEAFTDAVEKVGEVGLSIAKWGGAAAFGAVAYGVHGLNNELEATQISIGSILEVAGKVSDTNSGIALAGRMMKDMRRDAAALPGEFSDLIGIFRQIATPAFNAGMDPEALEKFSAQAMAAGAVMGLKSDMVGRELAQAIEGRVGAHNIFATRLGLIGADATKFKKESASERVEDLTARLSKYKGAIEAFSGSYEALSTTMIDNGKKFLGEATSPLFERVKVAMKDANDWFDANQGAVSTWAHAIGTKLVQAFDWGRAKVLEWGPAIATFADNAYSKIVSIWESVGPTVGKIGDSVREFLKSPDAVDKIIKVLELYIAAKAGGALSGLGGIAGLGGLGGALGKVGGAVTTGAVTYGAIQLAGNAAGQDDRTTDSMSRIGGGITAGAQLGGPIGAILGTIGGIALDMHEAGKEHDQIIQRTVDETVRSLSRFGDSMGHIDTGSKQFAMAMYDLTESCGDAAGALLRVASIDFNHLIDKARADRDAKDKIDVAAWDAELKKSHTREPGYDPKKKSGSGGGGGKAAQHIENVYITVSSNQAPGQIAHMVKEELANLRRYPRTSRSTNNFSATRR